MILYAYLIGSLVTAFGCFAWALTTESPVPNVLSIAGVLTSLLAVHALDQANQLEQAERLADQWETQWNAHMAEQHPEQPKLRTDWREYSHDD